MRGGQHYTECESKFKCLTSTFRYSWLCPQLMQSKNQFNELTPKMLNDNNVSIIWIININVAVR